MARRQMLMMLAVALMVAGLGVPSDAVAEPADHAPLELAGETVVHATGAAALRLNFPTTVGFDSPLDVYSKLSIDLHEGSVAFVGFDQLSRCTLVEQGWFGMCMGTTFWQFPEGVRPNPDQYFIANGQPVSAGPVDMFVVTDGAVTVTLRVPELNGRVEADARGELDATLVTADEFPVTCPAGDCHHLGWGGLTHEIGPGPGVAEVVAQSRVPPQTPADTGNPFGLTPVTACTYPSIAYAPNGSPDPDDHPTGCDLGVVTEDQRNHTLWGLAARAPGDYTAVSAGNNPVDGGPQYLGFTAGQFNPFEISHGSDWSGWYRADAVWLTQAYDCPASGCFTVR